MKFRYLQTYQARVCRSVPPQPSNSGGQRKALMSLMLNYYLTMHYQRHILALPMLVVYIDLNYV